MLSRKYPTGLWCIRGRFGDNHVCEPCTNWTNYCYFVSLISTTPQSPHLLSENLMLIVSWSLDHIAHYLQTKPYRTTTTLLNCLPTTCTPTVLAWAVVLKKTKATYGSFWARNKLCLAYFQNENSMLVFANWCCRLARGGRVPIVNQDWDLSVSNNTNSGDWNQRQGLQSVSICRGQHHDQQPQICYLCS